MCLVAIAHRCLADTPLAVAANREESHARQGTPPAPWPSPHPMAAGRDPLAGGTWLGVGRGGLVAAVTNRPPHARREASRGHLCRDLLGAPSAEEACGLALETLSLGRHGGCNVLLADPASAWVVHSGGAPAAQRLEPGLHLLAQGDVNDPADERQGLARRLFATAAPADAAGWLSFWPRVLGRHAQGQDPPVCLHHNGGGTISADVIVWGKRPQWLHAQGPPCTAGFGDCSEVLAGL